MFLTIIETILSNSLTNKKFALQIFSYLFFCNSMDRITKYFYKAFIDQFKLCLFTYRVKLRLVGNGYYFKNEGTQIFFYAGQSHLFNFVLPADLQAVLKGRKKRILVLESKNKDQLINFARYLQKFAYPDVYRQKGLRFVKQKLKTKEGKKKFV